MGKVKTRQRFVQIEENLQHPQESSLDPAASFSFAVCKQTAEFQVKWKQLKQHERDLVTYAFESNLWFFDIAFKLNFHKLTSFLLDNDDQNITTYVRLYKETYRDMLRGTLLRVMAQLDIPPTAYAFIDNSGSIDQSKYLYTELTVLEYDIRAYWVNLPQQPLPPPQSQSTTSQLERLEPPDVVSLIVPKDVPYDEQARVFFSELPTDAEQRLKAVSSRLDIFREEATRQLQTAINSYLGEIAKSQTPAGSEGKYKIDDRFSYDNKQIIANNVNSTLERFGLAISCNGHACNFDVTGGAKHGRFFLVPKGSKTPLLTRVKLADFLPLELMDAQPRREGLKEWRQQEKARQNTADQSAAARE
jgi:hypothetical protein